MGLQTHEWKSEVVGQFRDPEWEKEHHGEMENMERRSHSNYPHARSAVFRYILERMYDLGVAPEGATFGQIIGGFDRMCEAYRARQTKRTEMVISSDLAKLGNIDANDASEGGKDE